MKNWNPIHVGHPMQDVVRSASCPREHQKTNGTDSLFAKFLGLRSLIPKGWIPHALA